MNKFGAVDIKAVYERKSGLSLAGVGFDEALLLFFITLKPRVE